MLYEVITAILGSWSIVAYLFCGMLIMLIMLCFAEVGSKVTVSGGAYVITSYSIHYTKLYEVPFGSLPSRVSPVLKTVNFKTSGSGMDYPKILFLNCYPTMKDMFGSLRTGD